MSDTAARYEPDDAGVLLRPDYRPPHDYSDGAGAEAYVRDGVLGAQDVSDGSDELVRLVRDWPSEYHFSAARSSLLAPFDFAGLEVLEVGAGCGALTRALGEAGARVTALEGSVERARITAARCAGLDGVRVVCDDFAAYQDERGFDAVLMIGVLEYAPLYFGGADPVGAALRRAAACLAPGGALILAIENQLGLKYFAGCTEDHTGRLFYGIEDRYGETRGPVTFGRGELSRRLAAAGLGHTRFYYPFPDYKLPRLLLAEEALTDPRLDAGRLAAWVDTRDYLRPRARFFSEETAWEAIGRNGLVGEFANSFLVAASPGTDAPLTGAPPWLAELRATDRVRAYRTVTRIVDEDGGLLVRKTALAEAAAPPDLSPVALRLPLEGPFLRGRPLAVRVRALLERDGATVPEAAEALRPWAGLLTDAALAPDAGAAPSGPLAPAAGDAELPGGLLDLVPGNLMLAEADQSEPPAAALEPFDQEWASLRRLSLGHVVFRGLFHLLGGVRTTRALTAGETVGDLLTELAAELGVPLDAARLPAMTRREAEIQSAVTGMPFAIALESLERALERRTTEPPAEPPGDGGAAEAAATVRATELAQAAAGADLERRRLEARLDALEREFDALPGSGPTDRDAAADRLNLRRLREGSQRKLRAFAETSRSDGVAAAVASGGRSIWNSARYWTGNAPAAGADELPPEAYGAPCSWRQLPASTRRIDVVVSLAGATAAEAAATLDSLLHQSHLFYEVAVSTGAFADPDAPAVAREAAAADPRFSLVDGTGLPASAGPDRQRLESLAAAFAASKADLVLPLVAGDVLHGQALAELAHAVDLEPRCGLVYADTGTAERPDPAAPGVWRGDDFRKPGWSVDYLNSTPYVLGCLAIAPRLFERAGGLVPEHGAGALYDFVLRAADAGVRARHVERVLLRREGALPPGAPDGEDAADAAVLAAAAARLRPPAASAPGLLPGTRRLVRPAQERPPVTLVIVTGDAVSEVEGRGAVRVVANFLASIQRLTTYPDYRILVVDDGGLSEESEEQEAATGARRLTYSGNEGDPRGFNFSRKVNFALEHVDTEYFVLLNDDLEVIAPGWLEALMDYAVMPEVAAVGGHLLFPDGRTQHAGVIACAGGPGHAFYGAPEDQRSRGGSPFVVRDYAAVTGGLLAGSVSTLRTVGPFDDRLAHDYQDVDFCLRAGRLGYRVVYTPHCRLYHFEHASLVRSAPAPEDHALFMSRWADWCAHDPYFIQT